MGNSPSVSGPERGSSHVERNITMDGQMAGQRPANYYNTASSDTKLADEEPILDSNRKSHFKVITEHPLVLLIGSRQIMMMPPDCSLVTLAVVYVLQGRVVTEYR